MVFVIFLVLKKLFIFGEVSRIWYSVRVFKIRFM